MATATKAPTSDENVVGAWTGSVGTRYTLVDDYPDTVPNDVLDSPTASGGAQITFGFSAFAIPAGSTGISVQVQYYDRDVTSGNNNSGGRLKVGGTYYNAATHSPNTTLTAREDNWATNPKSSAAWTVDDINGVGTNAIQAFGFNSTDASPALRYSCVQIQVTYTPPISGSLSKAQAGDTVSGTGTIYVQGSLSKTQAGDGVAATGEVGTAAVSGSLDEAQAAQTIVADGDVYLKGSLSKVQAGNTVIGGGDAFISGVLSKAQAGQVIVGQGDAFVAGSISKTQDANGLTASGSVVGAGAISGLSNIIQAGNVMAGLGVVLIRGLLSKTQIAQSLVASGGNFSPISGILSVNQASQEVYGSSCAGPIFIYDEDEEVPEGHSPLDGAYCEWDFIGIHQWHPGG